MNFTLVVAVDKNFGIGKNNTIPWKLPSDLKHFSKITSKTEDPAKRNVVIMGRKTWESLPPYHRPLRNRCNVVLSRNPDIKLPDAVLLFSSIQEALDKVSKFKDVESIFIIGGGKVFEEAINRPDCQEIYLTVIEQTFDCDAFFPKIDDKIFGLVEETEMRKENDLDYKFQWYKRK